MPDGGDHQDLGYRRFSVLNRGMISAPRIEAIQVGGRAVVIISHEDISLGVLGVRRWGINGYGVDSARRLLTNILLYADDQLDGSVQSTVADQTASPDGDPTHVTDPGGHDASR